MNYFLLLLVFGVMGLWGLWGYGGYEVIMVEKEFDLKEIA